MKKNLLKFCVEALAQLLPYLLSITYMMLIIESVTYIGFIRKYVGLNSLHFMYVSSIVIGFMGIVMVIKPRLKHTFYTELVLRLQTLFVFPLAIIYYLLQLIEDSNYPNFIYSNIHIQPQNLQYLLILNLIVTVYYLCITYRKKIQHLFTPLFKSAVPTLLTVRLVVLFLISTYAILNAVSTMHMMIERIYSVLSQVSMTYEEKMKSTWGPFYDHMELVKRVTPIHAEIAIPPAQSHWLTDGNAAVVRYFLYPRRVVNLKETNADETLYQFPSEKYSYILLSKGRWVDKSVEYGWPKSGFAAKKIYYLEENGNIEEISIDYFDPSLEKNKTSFGLIEL